MVPIAVVVETEKRLGIEVSGFGTVVEKIVEIEEMFVASVTPACSKLGKDPS